MKFNKTFLITSVVAAMGMSAMANAADSEQLANSVQINFTGTFQDNTCDVNIDNKSGDSIDVYLGAYKTTAMKAANDTTPAVPFTVNFSNCGSIQNAIITFTGTENKSNQSLFSVIGSNADTVGVGINDDNKSTNYITSGKTNIVSLKDGDVAKQFFARYVKVGDTAVQPGAANSTVTMNIKYN